MLTWFVLLLPTRKRFFPISVSSMVLIQKRFDPHQLSSRLIRVRITRIMCCPAGIRHWFLRCTIIGVILDHWPGSSQKTHPGVNTVIIQNTFGLVKICFLLSPLLHCAGEIWKLCFLSEIWKLAQGNHVIIMTSLFSKSYGFKIFFSSTWKRQAKFFSFLRLGERLGKALFSRRICAKGGHRTLKIQSRRPRENKNAALGQLGPAVHHS